VAINIENGRRTVVVRPNWYVAGDMERAVVFEPGFNDRGGNYGVHGMDIRWLLRGHGVVTQFLMFTSWVPGEVGHAFRWSNPEAASLFPMGVDVGYHSPVPMYETHEPMSEPCDYLDGSTCYYDGSGLAADDLVVEFIHQGESVIWRELQNRHDEVMERVNGARNS